MKELCFLGVDLGAESGRLMAALWNGRKIRLKELHRFPNGPVDLAGTLRWDVLRLWSEVQQGLAIAGKRYRNSVQSVGVDTWGVDFVLLSRSNELLSMPYHYRDRRTRGLMEQAFRRVPRAEIFAETGLQFMELNTLYQLLALKTSSPEVLAAADCLLLMPDFFHWCLSGARVAEFTNATTTQFLHPTDRTWSNRLLRKFALPTRILPEVVLPGTVLGPMRSDLGKEFGLEHVRVVAPASHDTGSAVAAVPAELPEGKWAYISSGTWSLMGLELRKAQLSPRVLEFNLTNEGGVDGTYRLLKNIAGLWLVQQCKRCFRREGKDVEYAELVRMAAASAPLRSFIDPDANRFLNPPNMAEEIQAYCRETRQPVPGSRGALVRCALESIALKYQLVLGQLEEIGGSRVEVIHIVGGGSKNNLLNQFAADACGRPVLAGPVEATVLGNVMVQARTCAEVGSLSDIRNIIRQSNEIRRFEPRKKEAGRWEAARERFRKLTHEND